MEDLELHSLAERPDLIERVWDVGSDWPEFMLHDPVSVARYMPAMRLYPDLHLVVVHRDAVIARLHAVPIEWSTPEDLPEQGWDWALGFAVDQPKSDRHAVSLIEIRVSAHRQGEGLSGRLLSAAKAKFRASGTAHLVGPVRPNGKALEPRTPVSEYAYRSRADGLPFDNWLRVHSRAGGTIVKIAPLSMTIPGTLAQWRAWTGLPFNTSGLVDVPGALTPVLADVDQGHAVYVEPNVWVHHQL